MGIMYHLKELEAEELNLIATALSKLPFESVAPLIAKLRTQVTAIEAELATEKAAAATKEAAEKAAKAAATTPAAAPAAAPAATPPATPSK